MAGAGVKLVWLGYFGLDGFVDGGPERSVFSITLSIMALAIWAGSSGWGRRCFFGLDFIQTVYRVRPMGLIWPSNSELTMTENQAKVFHSRANLIRYQGFLPVGDFLAMSDLRQ